MMEDETFHLLSSNITSNQSRFWNVFESHSWKPVLDNSSKLHCTINHLFDDIGICFFRQLLLITSTCPPLQPSRPSPSSAPQAV